MVYFQTGSKIASILDSQKQQKAGKKDSFPVISNVMSLAPQGECIIG